MKKIIPVVGMACAACSANVERKLNSLDGVNHASVNLSGRNALVDYDPDVISLESMKREINDIGYDLITETDRSVVEIERRAFINLRNKTFLSWLFSSLVMVVSMNWIPLGNKDIVNQVALLLALGNLVVCGRTFYYHAWKQFLQRMASMDTLVALSTSVSFLFSVFNTFWGDTVWQGYGLEWHTYFDASSMIVTFVLTGRLLEEKAKNGTASSIRRLMNMSSKEARLVDFAQPSSQETEKSGTFVPLSTIEIGDIIEVHPGEKVPVDGEVTWAESFMTHDAAYVDESMITGEPTPAEKKKGTKVLAGTIPSQGKFRMRVRQIGKDTVLSHIIRMVQEAQGSKAPVQRVVDKAVLVFVPVVTLIAALTFILWLLIGGETYLPKAVMSSVAVLVVACPCAMGLATPTALMVGMGKAADGQILIKDATALENIRKIQALVMDKTGTLTIPNSHIDFTKSDDLSYEERETLKPHAIETIQCLQKAGIAVYLMSGDKEDAVRYWSEKVGISHYQSKVLPSDKESLVRRLQQEGKIVAMVGDGINDTQALALADVSMAMGKGTDVAMDVAQVTLMGDDLQTIPEAIHLSKETVKMIAQNLFWAFLYNLICIPLAAGVLYLFGIDFQITPMWASALMAFSSVSVVLNSLRLRYLA